MSALLVLVGVYAVSCGFILLDRVLDPIISNENCLRS